MGEGDAGTSRKAHPAASPARARGPQSGGSTGLAQGPEPLPAQSPAPASERLALGQPLPSPRRRRSGARARRRQARRVPHPARFSDPARQRRGHGCQRFVIRHNSAAPALPGQKFCAPHLPGRGPVSSPTLATRSPPAAQTPEPGTRCGAGPGAPSRPQGSGGRGST